MRLDQFRAIDLTHTLHEKIPTWNGEGCGFRLEIKMDYSEGVRVQSLKCHAGVGTHMDAPSHFVEGGKNIGDIPLEELIVPLCVLHVKGSPDLLISPQELKEFEKKHGKVPPKALFVASTGWERFWNEPSKYCNQDAMGRKHFPGYSKEAAEMLLERGIVGLGIDTLSPDGCNNGRGAHNYPVHLAVLGDGKYIVENLAHLDRVPPLGSYAICLPPKAGQATESTCRIIALVPSVQ